MIPRTATHAPTTPRPLAVVHVCAPAPVGGLERVVGALTAGLAERGHRVMLVAVLDEGAAVPGAIEAAGRQGVDLVPLRLQPRAYAAERHAVYRLAAGHGADIVHTHGYRADVVAGPAARRAAAARVSTAHGFTGGGVRNRFYEYLQRRAMRRCDAVVAVSERLAEALAEAGVGAVHTVVSGAPAQLGLLDAATARRDLGVPADAFHIGWVGRLSREKGPDVFLDALTALGMERPWAASVIGEGPLGGHLRERVAGSELGGRVRLMGRLDSAARLFRAFDVLVLSSRTEGTPIVLHEATAAGTPLVATDVGGVAAAIGADGALLVPSGQPAALADAIAAVAADPRAAARRVERARRTMAEAPDWIASYEAIYRSVVPDPHDGEAA
ncbi:MAG TPA: glycosyltransferase family 4 protein [Longimicrobiales bacterium]|nr:glycosyltransferase family 4 protein [Longimicrobiales bacterium]